MVEHDLRAVRRPIWMSVEPGVVGYGVLAGPISIYDHNLSVETDNAGVSDLFIVGRPCRIVVICSISQFLCTCSIRVHDKDVVVSVSVAGERDLFSIMRQNR